MRDLVKSLQSDETSVDYDAMKAESKERRARNRERSAQMLRDAGITFEERNAGAHLVVAGRYDFWPGTGLWVARGDKTKRRGVHSLVARILRGTTKGVVPA